MKSMEVDDPNPCPKWMDGNLSFVITNAKIKLIFYRKITERMIAVSLIQDYTCEHDES